MILFSLTTFLFKTKKSPSLFGVSMATPGHRGGGQRNPGQRRDRGPNQIVFTPSEDVISTIQALYKSPLSYLLPFLQLSLCMQSENFGDCGRSWDLPFYRTYGKPTLFKAIGSSWPSQLLQQRGDNRNSFCD
jgi:hypothetical protein